MALLKHTGGTKCIDQESALCSAVHPKTTVNGYSQVKTCVHSNHCFQLSLLYYIAGNYSDYM